MIILAYSALAIWIAYEEIKLSQRRSEWRRRRFYHLDPEDGELWE